MARTILSPSSQAADFSLVVGGPLFELWRRTRLTGDGLQLLHRRLIAAVALAWGPLLLLSIAEGHAWGASVALPFLNDVELHVRLLLAMPLLIVAELIVHRRIPPVVQQFTQRGVIPDSTRPRFEAAVASAVRLLNSGWAEGLLIAFVYVVGVGLVWTQFALDVTSWHGTPAEGLWRRTLAGWWLGCVSLPLFQFLLLRWYYRLFVWTRFLWQVSRIDLTIMPTHPDRCGGLGFLSSVVYAFAPLLLAEGTVLAGRLANRIFYSGATLPQFRVDLVGLVAGMVLAVLAPLLVFSRRLEAAKRLGLREHGALAQRYVREYDAKWLRGGAPPDEPLIGSADIQSLADLGHSFEVLTAMRWVPFSWSTVLQLAVTTLLPVLPLTLTMISREELLERLLKMLF